MFLTLVSQILLNSRPGSFKHFHLANRLSHELNITREVRKLILLL